MFVWVAIITEFFPTGGEDVQTIVFENREVAFKYLNHIYHINSPDEGEFVGDDYWYCDSKNNYDFSLTKKYVWTEGELK